MKELTEWLQRQNENKSDGNWIYSYRFAELQVASDFKLKTSDWDNAELADKEEMFAFWKTRREMAAWEQHLQDEKLEKMRQKGKK